LILICGTKEERRKRGERGGAENEAQNEHRRSEHKEQRLEKEAMDSCQRPLVATLSII
jgi:hypothetical protein